MKANTGKKWFLIAAICAAASAAVSEKPSRGSTAVPHAAVLWKVIPVGGRVTALAFSRDGRDVACAAGTPARHFLSLWDARMRRRKWRVRTSGYPEQLVFAPDGKVIAGCGPSTQPMLWDAKTGRVRSTLSHLDSGFGIAFSPNGHLLAVGGALSNDHPAFVYLVETRHWRTIRKLEGLLSECASVGFSSDGTLVAAANWSDEVYGPALAVWNVRTGRRDRVAFADCPQQDPPVPVYFLPRTRIVVCGMWKFDLDHQNRRWTPVLPKAAREYPGGRDCASPLCPNTSSVLLMAGWDPSHQEHGAPTMEKWDLLTRKRLQSWRGIRAVSDCMAVSPNGEVVAAAADHGAINLWRLM